MAALTSAAAAVAAAQESHLSLSAGSPENDWRPAVRPVRLLADSSLVRALRSGLPLRFHFELELWHDRWLSDALVDRTNWFLILYQEPLSGQFSLSRSWDPGVQEWFDSLGEAARALDRWYQASLERPEPGDGTYYYEARLRVEILSLGDLAELEHWLKGEVRGDGDLGGAVTRGLKRLFIRMIGLSARKYEARTAPFRPE